MKIDQLESYDLNDAIKFNDNLNPRIFGRDEQMLPLVRKHLLEIAKEFQEFLGVSNFELKDITISGSNAAYTYTPHSDVDLHLVVDIPKLGEDDVYKELFDAKKFQFNTQHNIKIGGYDVELYVQDSTLPHVSLGVYSVLNDKWVDIPKKQKITVDDVSAKSKYEDLYSRIQAAIESNDEEQITDLLTKISEMRKAGLAEHGEFSTENLVFKMLRTQGEIGKLRDARNGIKDNEFSLAEKAKAPSAPVKYGFAEDVTSSPDGVGAFTKMVLEEEPRSLEDSIKDFVQFCCDYLEIKETPRLRLKKDPQWSVRNKTFGRCNIETGDMEVAVGKRHIMDVFRTIAHELTHKKQSEREQMPDDSGETGSKYENEANAEAGIIMRNYAQKYPEYFANVSESKLNRIPLKFVTESITAANLKSYINKKFESYGEWYNIDKNPFYPNHCYNSFVFGRSKQYLKESDRADIKKLLNYLKGQDYNGTVAVGDKFCVLLFDVMSLAQNIAVAGFIIPKIITEIKLNKNGLINYITFDDGDRYPRLTMGQFKNEALQLATYHSTNVEAKNTLSHLHLICPSDWDISVEDFLKSQLNEGASGYIPTKAQANDPRFSMALTKDVRPGEVAKQANKMGLKVDKKGHPPLLKEAAVVPSKFDSLELDKAQPIKEAAVTPYKDQTLELAKAMELLNTHCKQALSTIQNPIWRGMGDRGDIVQIDPGSGIRVSQNTSNHYTELMDNSPYFAGYPMRSNSLVCTVSKERGNSYAMSKNYRRDAALYAIFPYDNVKIGICPMDDIWETEVDLSGPMGDRYRTTFGDLPGNLISMNLLETYWRMQEAVKQPKFAERLRRMNSTSTPQTFLDDVMKRMAPHNTGFQCVSIAHFAKTELDDEEVWFSGPCIAIRHDLYLKFLDAYQKEQGITDVSIIEESLRQELNELADSSYPFKATRYNGSDGYMFKTEAGQEYFVDIFDLQYNTNILVEFYAIKPRKEADVCSPPRHLSGITNTGDSFKVFSTVRNAILAYLQKNKEVDSISFSADAAEPSRVALYNRIAKNPGKWFPGFTEMTTKSSQGAWMSSMYFTIHKPNAKLPIKEDISAQEMQQIEKYADMLYGRIGIEVSFTKHFLERVRDARNGVPIEAAELARLLIKEYEQHGKQIAKLGDNYEAVMRDLFTTINMPFVMRDTRKGKELVAKTIIRKTPFHSKDPAFIVQEEKEPEVIDMLEEGLRDFQNWLLSMPDARPLVEDSEANKKFDSLRKSMQSPSPTVGNMYCPLEIIGMPLGKYIMLKGCSKPITLVDILRKENFTQYVFDNSLGQRITFPENLNIDDQIFQTFCYSSTEEFEKNRLMIQLKLDGDWTIIDKIHKPLSEAPLRDYMPPWGLQ